MITLVIHKYDFEIDPHAMTNSSHLFRQEFTRKGFNGTFNIVSYHHSLPQFFKFCGDKDIKNIEGDDLFIILGIATEWQCTNEIIDTISAQIFANHTVPELIVKLHECSDALSFVAAEKLPDLIKYSPFMLLPLSTLSKIFESSRVCMPNQIDLTNFVIHYFRMYGLPAINFVHYINPRILPQKKLAEINSVFAEFNCTHIFPEFDIMTSRISELRQYTIQAKILSDKLSNDENKLSILKSDVNEAKKTMAEEKTKLCDTDKKRNDAKEKLEDLKKGLDENNKFLQDYEELLGTYKKTKADIEAANNRIDKYKREITENEYKKNAYEEELKKYDPKDENALFTKMEKETLRLEDHIKKTQIEIDEFADNNKKLVFYHNQISKYYYHIDKLNSYKNQPVNKTPPGHKRNEKK